MKEELEVDSIIQAKVKREQVKEEKLMNFGQFDKIEMNKMMIQRLDELIENDAKARSIAFELGLEPEAE